MSVEFEMDASIRRLPVYVLIDSSGSMAGEPITALETGLRTLMAELTSDPQCLETVWLSVIVFSNSAEQLLPLTDVSRVELPSLQADGATALGDALELLVDCIDEEVRKTTQDTKGDWKPMTFVFTDGEPSDDWEEPNQALHDGEKTTVIACGAGPEIDEDVLRNIGDTVVRLQDTQPGTLSAFMKWVTASVTSTSRSLGTRATRAEAIPPPPEDKGIVLLP